jgi:predicted DNA-binding transcriptional regulator AlpA
MMTTSHQVQVGEPTPGGQPDEIGDLLGVSRQRADQLSRLEEFPEPVAVLSAGRVWRRADVEAWARETGRLS